MFDPKARLVGSDCLEYANFAARLKGEPLQNSRNDHILGFRKLGYSESAIKAFAEAYDKAFRPALYNSPSTAGYAAYKAGALAARETGGFCTPAARKLQESFGPNFAENVERLSGAIANYSGVYAAGQGHDDRLDAIKFAYTYARPEKTIGIGAGTGVAGAVPPAPAALRKAP